ncbi:uracil-DNA glycosylase [Wukongibacter sp. M2B1]|uniref:uracil-DNA glycosylase n=1 Tax=Wukongibacter sp. M2B1 TaxID=3088895 RepID=UPI003D7AAE76
MEKNNRVNCFKCKYFYITWDPNNPKGCKYFVFKTQLIPSIAVLKSSGKSCQAFVEKSNKD